MRNSSQRSSTRSLYVFTVYTSLSSVSLLVFLFPLSLFVSLLIRKQKYMFSHNTVFPLHLSPSSLVIRKNSLFSCALSRCLSFSSIPFLVPLTYRCLSVSLFYRCNLPSPPRVPNSQLAEPKRRTVSISSLCSFADTTEYSLYEDEEEDACLSLCVLSLSLCPLRISLWLLFLFTSLCVSFLSTLCRKRHLRSQSCR